MREITPPTKERIAKGDMVYTDEGIISRAVLRIDVLCDDGILTERQRDDCGKYLSYYLAARKTSSRSCLDIKEGGRLVAPSDSYIIDPMHYGNLFDSVSKCISPICRRWLQCVVIDGDSLSLAARQVQCRKSAAKERFLEAVSELQSAIQFINAGLRHG